MPSRRVFMKAGAMAMLSLGRTPSFLGRAAAAATARRRLVIAIFQRGAVDGLNMIVPHGDAEYYRLRPTIAIPPPGHGSASGSAIDLDGFFGLHPAMAPLKPLWDNRSLAIVHACGSPATTRSHFDAQDYLESATPDIKTTRDGWLNRYLQLSAIERNPLRGVALSPTMPRSLQGKAPALAIANLEAFGLDRGDESAVADQYERSGDALLSTVARDTFAAVRTLRDATRTPYHATAEAAYPATPFGTALKQIARLAKADVGLEVAFAEMGNWDHHVNEGGSTGQMASRLAELSRALAALATDLGDRLSDTIIVTMSEFGRAAAENGDRGTDHGHGNAMMVIGGPALGGIRGTWPGLDEADRFEGRDLAVTTDFRDVFGEIVTGHLGAASDDLAKVFPGFTSIARPGVIRV